MHSNQNEKFTYKFTPCKPPESCLDYDDYDPCGSNDELTEKDLAVLLKEEKLKLQQQKATEGKDVDHPLQGLTEPAKILKAAQIEKSFKDKLEKEENEVEAEEQDDQPGKKRVCKKFIKNPFYSNRLKLSSNLPPPPPNPPPQFFPPIEDTPSRDRINCQKRRKKCRKTDDSKKEVKEVKGGASREDIQHGKRDSKGKDSQDGNAQGEDTTEGKEEQEKRNEDYKQGGEEEEEEEEEEDTNAILGMDGALGGDDTQDKLKSTDDNDDETGKRKKHCKKTKTEKQPCRKKGSEISISLQPRQIPAAQRDLPPTSPRDIKQMNVVMKIPCKRVCKKKTNVK